MCVGKPDEQCCCLNTLLCLCKGLWQATVSCESIFRWCQDQKPSELCKANRNASGHFFFLWLYGLWESCISQNHFLIIIYLFIYFWLCWVFVSARGLSLVAASGGHSSSRCAALSLSRPLLLRSTGSRCTGSIVVAHGPSCSAACGIFPDRGSNPCPLHWQADSQPLRHQGSPQWALLMLLLLRML